VGDLNVQKARTAEDGVPGSVDADLVACARDVVAREAAAVAALAEQMNHGLADVISLLLECPGHVLVTGAGTSHAMAERFAHLLSCVGTPALCISASDAIHGGAGAIKEGDVLFAISKGGQSAEVNQFVDIARARGARVIAQTEDAESPLAQRCDAVYHVCTIGEVDPFGMIATGSSLVAGAAGDVLCALLLELRGYSRAAFGATHPGGAVGRMLEEGPRQAQSPALLRDIRKGRVEANR
jgi:D-arabinose 5-phosphate isomerase GutQ